jgi:hypothetical protein
LIGTDLVVRSAAIAAVISDVATILPAVLAADDTVGDDRGGPDDGRGASHGRPDERQSVRVTPIGFILSRKDEAFVVNYRGHRATPGRPPSPANYTWRAKLAGAEQRSGRS